MSFANYKSPFDEALSKPLIDQQPSSSTSSSPPLSSSSSIMSSIDNNPQTNVNNQFNHKRKGNLNKHNKANHTIRTNGTTTATATVTNPSSLITPTSSSSSSMIISPPAESFMKKTHYSNNNIHNNNNDTSTHKYQPPNFTSITTTMNNDNLSSLEEALLIERHSESQSILSQMKQISIISSEINNLVSTQQETINDIEYNANEVYRNTEMGVNELENVNGFLKRFVGGGSNGVEVFWKWFFGVIGIGGLCIALVIFLHSLR